jgi:hypothetical protein
LENSQPVHIAKNKKVCLEKNSKGVVNSHMILGAGGGAVVEFELRAARQVL